MNISIGSYKVRVEILVAIVVVFWIMFGHLLCSCCRMNLFEGYEFGKSSSPPALQAARQKARDADRAKQEADRIAMRMRI